VVGTIQGLTTASGSTDGDTMTTAVTTSVVVIVVVAADPRSRRIDDERTLEWNRAIMVLACLMFCVSFVVCFRCFAISCFVSRESK